MVYLHPFQIGIHSQLHKLGGRLDMIDAAIGWENVTVLRNRISHNSLAVRHVRWQYIVRVNAKNTIGRRDIRRCANMWQRNESVWKISVLYLEMLNRRIYL